MRIRSLLFAIWTFSASCFSSETALTIYTEEFPPYNFLQKGKVVGVNAEIVAMACEMAKIKCTFALFPWKRAMTLSLKDPKGAWFQPLVCQAES